MTGKKLIISALVLALVQIGFLSWIIAGRAAILRNGKEVLLKVQPVDPRDLLRGDYISLNNNISRIPVKLIVNLPQGKFSSDDTAIVVRLKKGSDGYWQPTAAWFGKAPAQQARTKQTLPAMSGKAGASAIRKRRSRPTTGSTASICRKAKEWRSRTTCACGRSASSSRCRQTARRRSRR